MNTNKIRKKPTHIVVFASKLNPPKTKNKLDTDLGVEVVCQAAQELALDGVLLGEQGQVVAQFVMGGDDGALAVLVKLRAACTSKNLHDVQDAQVH